MICCVIKITSDSNTSYNL